MTISEKFYLIKKACDQRKECEVQLKNELSPLVLQPIGICLTIKRGLIIVCKLKEESKGKRSLPKTCNFALEDCEQIRILEKKFNIPPGADENYNLCTDWLVHVSNQA